MVCALSGCECGIDVHLRGRFSVIALSFPSELPQNEVTECNRVPKP
jgi:hypothetical protein